MAQYITAWIEAGREVVFSPASHPCHPLWVPRQEGVDTGIGDEEGLRQLEYNREDGVGDEMEL